jgi:hypothetical protein
MRSSAQTATDICDVIASAEYTVNGSCVNQAFNKPSSFNPNMNPGTCNSTMQDDAWGWFTATSTFTTVRYQGDQDAILHLFTGTCAALEPLACADAFGGTAPESVTLPTVIGQDYFVRVQRFNNNGAMNGNLCVFSSNPSSACGTTVYDTGGPSGNYSNNQDLTYTYCPPVAGQMVLMDFTSFALEAGIDIFSGTPYDYMVIFDGPGTQDPIWSGYGNVGPGVLFPTHPSGCLTILFTSDGSDNFAGWAANVTCVDQPDCFYVLTLTDDAGDGWGSSSVGVSIGGGPFQNYTLNGASRQIFLPMNTGSAVVFNYNATGPDQIQNSWNVSILGQGGLYLSGNSPASGFHFSHTADCVPVPAPQEDCLGAFTICSDLGFSNTTGSTGFNTDLINSNNGCLNANERQGTWYVFSPSASGTLAFTISPTDPVDDYDFAIWGPYPPGTTTANVCPPPGPPYRCSYSQYGGDTGLNFSDPNPSEGQFGDRWVRYMDVLVDQVYLLYISNFSRSGLAFNMEWNAASTASLDCTVLPVDLLDLTATPVNASVELDWTTGSEYNASHFVVERRSETEAFSAIGTVRAIGESTSPSHYRFTDPSPRAGLNQYRLLQVDMNGGAKRSDVVVAMFNSFGSMITPNPASEHATLSLEQAPPPNTFLRITDARGRLVKEQRLSVKGASIPMSFAGIESGLYSIGLYDEHGTPLGHTRFVKE